MLLDLSNILTVTHTSAHVASKVFLRVALAGADPPWFSSAYPLQMRRKKRADEQARTAYPCSSYELDLSSSTEAEKSLTYRQNYPHSIVVLPSITSGLV